MLKNELAEQEQDRFRRLHNDFDQAMQLARHQAETDQAAALSKTVEVWSVYI